MSMRAEQVMIAIGAVLVLWIVGMFLFMAVDYSMGHWELRKGRVVAKSYVAGSTSVGSGVGQLDGKPMSGTTVTSTSSRCGLLVQFENGDAGTFSVSAVSFANAVEGPQMDMRVKIGWLSGSVVGLSVDPVEEPTR